MFDLNFLKNFHLSFIWCNCLNYLFVLKAVVSICVLTTSFAFSQECALTLTGKVFEVEGHAHGDETNTGSQDSHDEHQEIELEPNSSYLFEIRFYNDEDPTNIEDITLEVIEEADEHHVFYELTDGANITITSGPGDTMDSNSNPLNLITRWTTTAAGVADVEAYLIHEPTSKTGDTRDDFGGATDVEIEFEAHVE